MTAVAVYGTLKSGGENYARYLHGLAPVYAGPVRLPFRMLANGDYPMLVESADERRIHVEVFEVDAATLARIDALEEPYGYERRRVLIPEIEREVEIYVFSGEKLPAGFEPVEDGRWEP